MSPGGGKDVTSRYEMLWQQHYGTSDATWKQLAPVYRYAWYVANQPNLRGRPWAEVEQSVRSDWESTHSAAWETVAGPIFDVWKDVAEEAATLTEGGQARRMERLLEQLEVPIDTLTLVYGLVLLRFGVSVGTQYGSTTEAQQVREISHVAPGHRVIL